MHRNIGVQNRRLNYFGIYKVVILQLVLEESLGMLKKFSIHLNMQPKSIFV